MPASIPLLPASNPHWLHNLTRNTEDAIGKASELINTLIKARNAAGESQDNSRKEIAGKEIEEMEQRGVISHATALRMKEQLDIQYEQQRLLRIKAQNQLEFDELQRQQANREIAGHLLEEKEAAAAARYRERMGAKAANDTKISEAEAKIKNAEAVKHGLRAQGVTEENVQELIESYEKVSGDGSGKTSLSEMFTYLSRHYGGITPQKNLWHFRRCELGALRRRTTRYYLRPI